MKNSYLKCDFTDEKAPGWMIFRVGWGRGQAEGRAGRKVPNFEEWQGCPGPNSAFV